jgi:PAS domain S-box-containing protein
MQDYLYKAITENSTDGVVVTDVRSIDEPEGRRIIYVNDAYLHMTGYAKKEVIGKTPRPITFQAIERMFM